MGLLTLILLFFFSTVFSSPVCNPIDDCACIPGSDLEVQCPKAALHNPNVEHLVLHFIKSYQITKIDCKNTRSFRMDLLPNIIVPEKTRLEIDSCPPPPHNFKEISDHFCMSRLEVIQFANYANVTLKKRYFEGLHLDRLKFADLESAYIDEDAFSNLSSLYSLEIGNNKNLTLNVKAFRNLSKLHTLSLIQDRLETVPEGLFESLGNLSVLHLFNNNLKVITDATFSGLSNLTSLELRTNKIRNISDNAFRNLKQLRAVNLSDNKIRTISPNIFQKNQKLTKIFMTFNRELQLPDYLFANLIKLTNVDLSRCNLASIPEHIFENSTNLINMSLEDNKLETIPPGLLQGFRKLEKLNLGRNFIREINRSVFKDLVSLKIINLERNKIVMIHHGAFSSMKNLIRINLSHNSLSYISEAMHSVESLDLSHNLITNISDIVNSPFEPKLKELDLSNNLITELKLRDLPFSYNMEINLDYNNITKVDFKYIEDINITKTSISLSGNLFDCSCNNYLLFQFLNKQIYKEKTKMFNIATDLVVCGSPQELSGSKLVELQPADITCDIKNSSACPLECSCSWRPFDTSVVINCSERNLTEFPAIDHEELMNLFTFNQTEMHLQGNALVTGPSGKIKGYDNITRLYLSNNNIKHVEWLPPNLKVVHLDNNKLTSVGSGILNLLNKTDLTLHNNPWSCDCDALTFSNFLRQHPHRLDVSNINCHHDKKLRVHNLSETDLCQTKLVFYILLPVLSFVLFIMVLLFLFYRYQEEIKVWLFAHGYLLWWVTEEELDKDKEYDAFISYSHKDEDFVVQNLLPVLESPQNPYKLCLHYRNFIPGEFISTQVTNSVLKSRRTLVVLSPNFLESVWGKMEFRTAHSQAMSEGRVRVIIVLYGDVDVGILDDELKAYLKTNTYVKWGDPYFWNKLRYAMPHSKRKTLKNEQKIANVMSCIDDKFNLMEPVTPSPNTTPPVLSLSQTVLKKSPLEFVPRQQMSTPPAEAGVTV